MNTCEKCGEPYTLRQECEPTSLCDLCCQTEFESMKQQLAAEKAARLKAEAACAEMRATLKWVLWTCEGNDFPRNTAMCVNHQNKIRKVLSSTSCGKDWLSPEVAGKVRKVLEELASYDTDESPCLASDAKEALALLDGKEPK